MGGRAAACAAAGGAAHLAAAPPGIMFIMGVSTSRKPCMSRKRRTKLMILVRVTKMSRVAARCIVVCEII